MRNKICLLAAVCWVTVFSMPRTSGEDFLQTLHAKLAEKNDALQNWQTDQIGTIQNSVDRPDPVQRLTPALQTRSWLFDPSIKIPSDVRDAKGNLIMQAGSEFNPLSKVSWTQKMVFYDSDNPKQVNWAHAITLQNQAVKYILVNGSISDQTQKLQKKIYFDQGGQLVQRLDITHTPALVQQEGLRLRITEYKL